MTHRSARPRCCRVPITAVLLLFVVAFSAHDSDQMRQSSRAKPEQVGREVSVSLRQLSSSDVLQGGGLAKVVGARRRQLDGEFEKLNGALSQTSIRFAPSIEVSPSLSLSDLVCRDLAIQDMQLSYATPRKNDTALHMHILVSGFSFACTADAHYRSTTLGFISTHFPANVHSHQNTISIDLDFPLALSADESLPRLTSCTPQIHIDDLDLGHNKIVSSIVHIIEKPLKNEVEGQIMAVLCGEHISTLEVNTFGHLLSTLRHWVDFYVTPIHEQNQNNHSKHANKQKSVLPVQHIHDSSFLATESTGSWLRQCWKRIVTVLGTNSSDPTSSSKHDLPVNTVIRSMLLDGERALAIPFSHHSLVPATNNSNMSIHDTQDMQIITELTFIQIFGLDTITEFDSQIIMKRNTSVNNNNNNNNNNNYTLSNHFCWDDLRLDANLTITINPSSLLSQNSDKIVTIDTNLSQQVEHTLLTIGIHKMCLDIEFLVSLDLDKLAVLPLGSLLHSEQTLSCVIADIVQVAQFTDLKMSAIESLQSPTITGFISPGVDTVITIMLEAMVDIFDTELVQAIPNFIRAKGMDALNEIIEEKLHNSNKLTTTNGSAGCHVGSIIGYEAPTTTTSYLDFREMFLSNETSFTSGGTPATRHPYGNVFSYLKYIMDEKVFNVVNTSHKDDDDELLGANQLFIGPLTNVQSNTTGEWNFLGHLYHKKTRLRVAGLSANLEMSLFDVCIDNLNSAGLPWNVLQPVQEEAHVLHNTVTFGVAQKPMRVSAKIQFAFTGNDDIRLNNTLSVSLDFDRATMSLAALADVSENGFLSFPLREILNVYCWVALIPAPPLDEYGIRLSTFEPSAAITDLAVSVAKLRLNVSCISCSSPGLRDLATKLSSQEGSDEVTRLAKLFFTDDANRLRFSEKIAQIYIDRTLNEAPKKCPLSSSYSNKSSVSQQFKPIEGISTKRGNSLSFMMIAFILVGLVILGAFVVVVVANKRYHQRWLSSLSSEQIQLAHTKQTIEKENEEFLNRSTSSMVFSDVIPLYVRVCMPLLILANIAFFLSGHLSLGATVNVEVLFAQQVVSVQKFFEFSMAKSALQMWNARAKSLAVLLVLFSGVWPYTKQFLTLYLWFSPPARLSTSRRGSILLWLDALGKWSMIDVFVLLMSIVAFRVTVLSPTTIAFLPENFYSAHLMVVPVWGLYANLIAQIMSQISSHFIIHYHRCIVTKALIIHDLIQDCKDEDDDHTTSKGIKDADFSFCDVLEADESDAAVILPQIEERREALYTHAFEQDLSNGGQSLTVRPYVNYALALAAVFTAILIIWGCIQYSFSLEVIGLIGVAIEVGQNFEEAKKRFSVFKVIGVLMDQARFLDTAKDKLGLGALSSLLILTVLIIPLAQVALLMLRWFVPLSSNQRSRAFAGLEVLRAWQYIEVYILAIVISSWQLGGVSDFMINDYCGSLQSTLSFMAYLGIISSSDAQCFRVEAKMEVATLALTLSALCLALLGHFVLSAASHQDRDESNTTQGKLNTQQPTNYGTLHFSGGSGKIRLNDDDDDDNDTVDVAKSIHLTSPRFSEYYRFFLQKSDHAYDHLDRSLEMQDMTKCNISC